MLEKSIHARLVFIGALGLVCCLLSSCRNNFTDTVNILEKHPLQVPQNDYEAVVWLDNDTMAFRLGADQNGDWWKDQIGLYALNTREWQLMSFAKPEKCRIGSFGLMSRLPDGTLGFIYKCYLEFSFESALYAWDENEQQAHLLQKYPVTFSATAFSFSPDMTKLIQEDTGSGIQDKLFRVSQNGEMKQLFTEYMRAGSPSWSPDGDTVAFAATETGPREKKSIFTGLVGIANEVLYPWDLYLMDADGGNVRPIFAGIVLLRAIEWSPQNDHIAFVGEYGDKDGTWILNVDTSELVRVWPVSASYDWSPNGQQLVVIDCLEQEQAERCHPVIVDVPLSTR